MDWDGQTSLESAVSRLKTEPGAPSLEICAIGLINIFKPWPASFTRPSTSIITALAKTQFWPAIHYATTCNPSAEQFEPSIELVIRVYGLESITPWLH